MSVSLNDRPNKVTVSGDTVTVTTGSGVQGPQGATGATGAGGTVAYFGNFFSTETQPNVSVSAANTFTLNSTVDSNGVSIVDGSKITFAAGSDGTYDLQFSVQFDKTDSGTDEVDVWLSKNGTNEDWSNTVLSLVGNNAKVVAAWNFQLNDVEGGDFFQLHWWSPDADMRALAAAAGTSPSRPAVPSLIVTVAQVTYTQLGPTGATGPQGPTGATGATGAQGDPGVAVQGTAPANTSILWADTSEAGDAVVPTGGTTGQALVKQSNSDYDTTWATQIPASLLDAKGDLIVASAADTAARLAVGATDGHVLTVDATQSLGIKWAALPSRDAAATGNSVDYWGIPGCITVPSAASVVMNGVGEVAFYSPMTVASAITIVAAQISIVTVAASSGGVARLSCYSADGTWQPVALIADWGEVTTTTTGDKNVTSLSTALSAGRYLLRVHINNTATQPNFAYVHSVPVGNGFARDFSLNGGISYMRRAVTYGPAESNPSPWNVISNLTGSAGTLNAATRSLIQVRWTS